MAEFRNPVPTVDILIEMENRGIVLIERLNPPHGWALPGGFVDYGESLETAARREALEETGLQVQLIGQFYTYSDPDRDPRQHTLSTVFIGRGAGRPIAASDAKNLGIFREGQLPSPIAFDHDRILRDYFEFRKSHPDWVPPVPL